MGKSSLLKALVRRYQTQPDITCFYLALSNEVLLPRLAKPLALPENITLDALAEHLAKTPGRFVFLIDEADKFIRHERKHQYQQIDAFRRISEEGHCTFILAGFWALYEHAVLDYQSPLKNFGEVIEVGSLETEACRQLAIEPMQTLRLEYASSALVEDLLKTTGQRANLIALVCHQLLTQLQPNQRVIEAGDMHKVLYHDKTFNALKGWATMVDDESACRVDRLIVYATVEQNQFSFAELIDLLQQHELSIDSQQLDHSLARLELGFVLGRDSMGHYYYRVPLFQFMIKKDAPEVRLQQIQKQLC